MNPVFIILLIIAAIVVWLFCVFIFIPLGGAIKKIINKVYKTVNNKDTENKEEPSDDKR